MWGRVERLRLRFRRASSPGGRSLSGHESGLARLRMLCAGSRRGVALPRTRPAGAAALPASLRAVGAKTAPTPAAPALARADTAVASAATAAALAATAATP